MLLIILSIFVFTVVEKLVYGKIDTEHCLFKLQWSGVNTVHMYMDIAEIAIVFWVARLIDFKFKRVEKD